MMDPDKINIKAFSRKGENRTERLTEPNRRIGKQRYHCSYIAHLK